jgi:hypothetical protein
MIKLPGNMIKLTVDDKVIEDIESITIDSKEVVVSTLYPYNGPNGGDCIGVSRTTYSKSRCTIIVGGRTIKL